MPASSAEEYVSNNGCCVKMEEESWKKEDEGGNTSPTWGPPSITMENEEGSKQPIIDSEEYDGSHFNYAYFEVWNQLHKKGWEKTYIIMLCKVSLTLDMVEVMLNFSLAKL